MPTGGTRVGPLAAVVLVGPLALAGCVGTDTRGEENIAPTGAADRGPSDAAETALLAWDGYIRAGAAYEVPGHIEETSGTFRPVWSMSFQLHVEGAPEAMEVTLSWTAPLARLLLMVTEPFDRDTPAWYESPATDRSPICFGIPPDALRPGVWRVMAHSEVAVDAVLAFGIAMTEGAAEVVDEPSDAPAPEFPFIVLEAQTPPPLSCAAA